MPWNSGGGPVAPRTIPGTNIPLDLGALPNMSGRFDPSLPGAIDAMFANAAAEPVPMVTPLPHTFGHSVGVVFGVAGEILEPILSPETAVMAGLNPSGGISARPIPRANAGLGTIFKDGRNRWGRPWREGMPDLPAPPASWFNGDPFQMEVWDAWMHNINQQLLP